MPSTKVSVKRGRKRIQRAEMPRKEFPNLRKPILQFGNLRRLLLHFLELADHLVHSAPFSDHDRERAVVQDIIVRKWSTVIHDDRNTTVHDGPDISKTVSAVHPHRRETEDAPLDKIHVLLVGAWHTSDYKPIQLNLGYLAAGADCSTLGRAVGQVVFSPAPRLRHFGTAGKVKRQISFGQPGASAPRCYFRKQGVLRATVDGVHANILTDTEVAFTNRPILVANPRIVLGNREK
mmetsp:Transcript_20992/g.35216  ORF Transcript_20992/g.35216 Transcript_20992/m.35216 type:complete len:235 (-) Transcript_20992:740-1444(-)